MSKPMCPVCGSDNVTITSLHFEGQAQCDDCGWIEWEEF